MPCFRRFGSVSSLPVVLLFLLGCNALNPLCGSARAVPTLTSISPSTIVFSQLPPTFVLTAAGSQFVSASVIVFNGTILATTVKSGSQATASYCLFYDFRAGTFNVDVQTPGGNSGNLGCSSGGTSSVRVLTVN